MQVCSRNVESMNTNNSAGQVSSQLFTSQGEPITSIEQFEDLEDNMIVVAGPEEFRQVDGGYEDIIYQHESAF